CPHASNWVGSTYVTLHVPEIDRSPRTRIALTAEPGTSGSGCFVTAAAAPPSPATGVIPNSRNLSPNRATAFCENPPNTSAVSIGCTSPPPAETALSWLSFPKPGSPTDEFVRWGGKGI